MIVGALVCIIILSFLLYYSAFLSGRLFIAEIVVAV